MVARRGDIAVRGGWKNRDEVRSLEELGPIPDGDIYLWPPGRTAPTEGEDQDDDAQGGDDD